MPLCSKCGGRKSGRHCQRCSRSPELRASAHDRGYNGRWKRASRAFLARPENKLCRHCGRAAECTDHIKPHGGDPDLFWDEDNWQPLCIKCNTRKGNRNGNNESRHHSENADNCNA